MTKQQKIHRDVVNTHILDKRFKKYMNKLPSSYKNYKMRVHTLYRLNETAYAIKLKWKDKEGSTIV